VGLKILECDRIVGTDIKGCFSNTIKVSDSRNFAQVNSTFWRICKKCLRQLAHTDRTRFGNATRFINFQWHVTLIFFYICFSNIRNYLSNLSYLACISCKIFIRRRFYSFLKTGNSRSVAESRPVCVGPQTYVANGLERIYQWQNSYCDQN
jgi:hypothetical protein